jgi:hypothetical protein
LQDVIKSEDNEALEKAKKDIAKLTKKQVVDKNGKMRTVYVKVGEDKKEGKEERKSNVWTDEQVKKDKELNERFQAHLKKEGIEPNSHEASKEWRKAGFQDEMKKIFGKEEKAPEQKSEKQTKFDESQKLTPEQEKYYSENKQKVIDILSKDDEIFMTKKEAIEQAMKEDKGSEKKEEVKMNNLDWGKTTEERNSNLDKYESLKTKEEKEAFIKKLKSDSEGN